ncbi:DUF6073 family protein [Tardiphaga sp. OK246]|uniref:DUF6073 family protein n=1 Tax=Tardiphaga sp. OK246 TaxID=1855307 RepID=UPI000B7789A8|nr:DUF6073 family protein [Tardiphaga sp. OK246]
MTSILIDRYLSMSEKDLAGLASLPVKRFTLPTAGVDIMRAVVEETYTIDGVGKDTVLLTGWIAVKHDSPRLIRGATKVQWGSAQLDTEFVGLSLRGHSLLFGEVFVTLNSSEPSLGVVGAWHSDDVPKQAQRLEQMIQLAQQRVAPGFGGVDLLIEPRDGAIQLAPRLPDGRDPSLLVPLRPGQQLPAAPFGPINPTASCSLSFAARACNCAANLYIMVSLPNLGLALTTDGPVYMYSSVETIPPVGYTATVTLTPTDLIADGRRVGTLEHAAVKFRELVEHMSLDPAAHPEKRISEDVAKQ